MKKEELIEVAYNLFITKGYENTSVDEIVASAKIAKGTFYYHFKSKEQLLEKVVNMMIDEGVKRARNIADKDLNLEEKLVYTILALRILPEEKLVKDTIHTKENIILHKKLNDKLINEVVPILSKIVREAKEEGIFNVDDNIEQRVRMTLILSNEMFDHNEIAKKDVLVFIDILEKMYGAKRGSFSFIAKLIKEDFNEK